MNEELNIDKMLELRNEYIKSYVPDMDFIMKNGSPNYFFESKDVKTFEDMILYLSECIDEKHDKDKDKLLNELKDFPVGMPFDVNALYEIHKVYSLIILVNNFKDGFYAGFTNVLEKNDFYFDDIPKKLYYNNIVKFIDTRYSVVSAEDGYIFVMKYKYITSDRHVFTLHIDERIADILNKRDYCKLGKKGKLRGLDNLLFHAGGCAGIVWQY